MNLRSYQLDMLDRVKRCGNKVLVVQPTGTGKTVFFMSYAINYNCRTLVLVNSEELIE